MGDGFITLHRSVQKHWIWQEPEALKFWVALLLEANWQEKKTMFNGKLIAVKRGELVFGRRTYAKKLAISDNKIRRYIELLKNDNMITHSITNKYSIISITNYDSYQTNHQQTTRKTTSKPPTETVAISGLQPDGDQQTTRKPTTSKQYNNTILITKFCEWWSLYPRKVGKQKAQQSWLRSIKSEKYAEQAINNLKIRNSAGQKGGYGASQVEFIKHPSTFLNQGMWSEQPENLSSTPSPAYLGESLL